MRVPRALNPRVKDQLLKRFGVYDLVDLLDVTPSRSVPDSIAPPDYVTGKLLILPRKPEIKDAEQIQGMRKSCKLAYSILSKVKQFIQPGISTDQIDDFVHNLTIESGAYPSPLKYKGFPKSVCTSVNNVVVHGIPDVRPLQDGDIINVDITVFYEGFHGDCSKTFTVGNVDARGIQLINVTEECLEVAIKACGPDVPFSEIGNRIYHHAKKNHLTVLPDFFGHGIGEYFHGPPEICHTKNRYPGLMKPGMTFTIEPVLSHGSNCSILLTDGWTVITEDGSRAAQTERTILITEDGAEVLTK